MLMILQNFYGMGSAKLPKVKFLGHPLDIPFEFYGFCLFVF